MCDVTIWDPFLGAFMSRITYYLGFVSEDPLEWVKAK